MSRMGPRSAQLVRRLFWIFKNGPVSAAETRRFIGARWMPVLVAKGYIEIVTRATTRGRRATYAITERGRKRLELEMRRAGTRGGGDFQWVTPPSRAHGRR